MIRKTTPAAIALAVAAIAGCGGSSPSTQPTPAALTTLQACQRLRADMVRNGGTPDQPTLQRIVARVTSPKVIKDTQLAISNIKQDQQNGDALGFTPGLDLLTYDCRQVGVQLPVTN
jgi:hypothetical protein